MKFLQTSKAIFEPKAPLSTLENEYLFIRIKNLKKVTNNTEAKESVSILVKTLNLAMHDSDLNILGVKVVGGSHNLAYIMLKKPEKYPVFSILEDIKDHVSSKTKSEHLVTLVTPSEKENPDHTERIISGYHLYSLLLNSSVAVMASKSVFLDGFNNVSGKLLYYPDLKKPKDSFVAISVTLGEDMDFSVKSHTFRLKEKVLNSLDDKTTYLYQKLKSAPAYLVRGRNLIPVNNLDKEDLSGYIEKGFYGSKASTDALSIKNHHSFLSSRFGILSLAIDLLNNAFGDYLLVSLQQIPVASHSGLSRSSNRKTKARSSTKNNPYPTDVFTELLSEKMSICIVDRIDDFTSRQLAKDLKTIFERCNFNCFQADSEQLANPALSVDKLIGNICLVYSKDYYKEQNLFDPYAHTDGYITQHFTVEVSRDDKTKEVKDIDSLVILVLTCLKELFFKQQVYLENSPPLPDLLSYLKPKEPLYFAKLVRKKEENISIDHWAMIKQEIDGSIKICDTTPKPTGNALMPKPITGEGIPDFITTFVKENFKEDVQPPIELFIFNEKGDINFIQKESLFVVPDLNYISNTLKSIDEDFPDDFDLNKLLEFAKANIDEEMLAKNQDAWDDLVISLREKKKCGELTKSAFKELIKKYFKPKSKVFEHLMVAAKEQGVPIIFSKSEDHLKRFGAGLMSLNTGYHADGSGWYANGYYKEILQHTLPNFVPVRTVRVMQGACVMNDLLPFIDVDFVRYRQTTALPYQHKYLLEQLKRAGVNPLKILFNLQ